MKNLPKSGNRNRDCGGRKSPPENGGDDGGRDRGVIAVCVLRSTGRQIVVRRH